MTGDASMAGDAYPVDAPGLAPSGVHAIQTFCILELSFLWIYYFWLTLEYTTFIFNIDYSHLNLHFGVFF